MSTRDEADNSQQQASRFSLIVKELCEGMNGVSSCRRAGSHLAPLSNTAVQSAVESLRSLLFPGYFGIEELHSEALLFHIGAALDRVRLILEEQVERSFCYLSEMPSTPDRAAREIVQSFFLTLPNIQRLLVSDVEAAFAGDPAATSRDEALLCYPGILALTSHRIAHELHRLGVPLIPRMISELAHGATGIDIHPGATIGESFFIDHGTGVVIGETCEIGKRVRVYQGVTLGAKSFPLDHAGRPVKGIKRHPIVEDDVVIYSGATILGRIVIGRGAVIGGNVWLTNSVDPHSFVHQSGNKRETFDRGLGI